MSRSRPYCPECGAALDIRVDSETEEVVLCCNRCSEDRLVGDVRFADVDLFDPPNGGDDE